MTLDYLLTYAYICLPTFESGLMSTKKDASVTIRVRAEEYVWMERAAKSEDLSISSFLRRILLKHLRENYSKLEKK